MLRTIAVFALCHAITVWSQSTAPDAPFITQTPNINVSIVSQSNLADLKSRAKSIATDMLVPFGQPVSGQPFGTNPSAPGWYWWTYGVMWDSVINFGSYTEDQSFSDDAVAALVSQSRSQQSTLDFWCAAQVANGWLAVDDVTWWANAALTALEENLPEPDPSLDVTWQQMAENAYDRTVQQVDNTRPLNDCSNADANNLGAWWKMSPDQKGGNWVSSITNAGLLSMAARLYKATGDQKYADRAEHLWQFSVKTELVFPDMQTPITPIEVRDGFSHPAGSSCMADNQSRAQDLQNGTKSLLGYNLAVYMHAASVMVSIPNSPSFDQQELWRSRTIGLLLAALSPNTERLPAKVWEEGGVTYADPTTVGEMTADPGFTFESTGVLFSQQYEPSGKISQRHDHTVHKAIMSSALLKTGINLNWPTDYNIKHNIGVVLQNTAYAIIKNDVCAGFPCKQPFDPQISSVLPASDDQGDNSGASVSALEVLQDLIYMLENNLLP